MISTLAMRATSIRCTAARRKKFVSMLENFLMEIRRKS